MRFEGGEGMFQEKGGKGTSCLTIINQGHKQLCHERFTTYCEPVICFNFEKNSQLGAKVIHRRNL